MEEAFWSSIFYFFSGAIAYKILSDILGLGYGLNIINKTIISSLKILLFAHDSYEMLQEAKYDLLEKSGISEEEIATARHLDAATLSIWRSMSISTIMSNVPNRLRRGIRFRDWESAKDFLNQG